MKIGVKLSKADKIGLAVAGVVVWSIGILPSAIIGGIGYTQRNRIKEFFIRREVQKRVKSFLSIFNIK